MAISGSEIVGRLRDLLAVLRERVDAGERLNEEETEALLDLIRTMKRRGLIR